VVAVARVLFLFSWIQSLSEEEDAMRDAAEELFEDESVAAEEGAVEALIRSAHGDPRRAILSLLTKIEELGQALASAEGAASRGFRRLQQPPRQT
jgi:transposase